MESERPNRSDTHLSAEEAAKAEAAARGYFDEVAPKRHTKPQRSEYSSAYADALSSDDQVIPEYAHFQQLEKDTQELVYRGNNSSEEFIETEYYKDLNHVDKQHHTKCANEFGTDLFGKCDKESGTEGTGTGFIKFESTNEKGFSLAPDSGTEHHAASKGNPATNDWIPATHNTADLVTGKPNRSG